MKKIQVAIVHYNTPELTEAGIKSLRKHGGAGWPVTVFDNSDSKPFKAKMDGVKVIDNTNGKVIDFEAELAKYPDRNIELGKASNDGSFKHILSVQKLWELLPDGFILMESDVLIKKDISFLWDEKWAATGRGEWFKGRRREHDRLYPFLCYMNVPVLVKHGAKYFDPDRCWNLYPDFDDPRNYWDTGACLLDCIIKTKPALRARLYPNLFDCFEHYHGGSWRQNDGRNQQAWLEQHKDLWYIPENKNAKIYICAHKDFDCPVSNSVYQIVDARKTNKDMAPDGLRGLFYSEILTYQRIAAKKTLPKTIGFCGWRKYFAWMDNVPELEGRVIVSKAEYLGGMTMREQYDSFSNVEDLDLLTSIIDERFADFSKAWHTALDAKTLHPYSMFVMPTDDFKRMMKLVSDLLKAWVNTVGTDIEVRIAADPKKYHVGESPVWNPDYQYRIGGELGERIISAWIDWQFPQAEQVSVNITSER